MDIFQRILVLFLFFLPHFSKSEEIAPSHSAYGEGKVLPEGVWRVRAVHKEIRGEKGWDERGQAIRDLGLQGAFRVSAGVLEYGLTPNTSLQVLVPRILKNDITLDKKTFLNSKSFLQAYDNAVDQLAEVLQNTAGGGTLCHDRETCRAFIQSGKGLPLDTVILLPTTGEALTVHSGVPLNQVLKDTLYQAASPGTGTTGLGDVEMGLLHSFMEKPHALFSGGVGLRCPTGAFRHIPASRHPLSGGAWDGAIQFNYAHEPLLGFWISYQTQWEKSLTQATWKRSSDLNKDEFSPVEDPFLGEGLPEEHLLTRSGLVHKGTLKMDYGLGVHAPWARAWVIEGRYQYQRDREEWVKDQRLKKSGVLHSLGCGIFWSGLLDKIPLGLDFGWDIPVGGENKVLSPEIYTLVVKGYAKF